MRRREDESFPQHVQPSHLPVAVENSQDAQGKCSETASSPELPLAGR